MSVHHLIATYGYAAVFVMVAIESLGVPLPGETTLIAAGTYAGANHKLSVWLIFACAAAGAILGDTIGYWIGDKGGYRLAFKYGHYVRLDEPKIKLARYLFDRHGGPVVFFGRFVSVLRTYAAFLAGTSLMRYRRFLVFNAAGGIVWAAIYTFGSYYAGAGLSRLSGPVTYALIGVAVAAVVVGIVVLRRKLRPLEEAAEAAYPGPLEPPGEGQDRQGHHEDDGALEGHGHHEDEGDQGIAAAVSAARGGAETSGGLGQSPDERST